MPEDSVIASHSSFPDLYVNALWNMHAGATIMLMKLPEMAAAISYQELATLLRDTLGQTSHAVERLEAMLSAFGQPARVHAAEMETLVGTAAHGVADWPAGDPLDVAVCTVVRAAIHVAIPGCEMAIILADAIGYKQHAPDLKLLLHEMQTTDGRLLRIVESRILAAHAGSSRGSPSSRSPQPGADSRA